MHGRLLKPRGLWKKTVPKESPTALSFGRQKIASKKFFPVTTDHTGMR